MKGRALLVTWIIVLSLMPITMFLVSDVIQRVPSAGECAELWNRSSDVESQRDVMRFDRARAAGWDTKAGPHCSVHFFSRPGAPWVMYVLWLAAPNGLPDSFSEDIGGDRYGGGELGGEESLPANAMVGTGGRITLL